MRIYIFKIKLSAGIYMARCHGAYGETATERKITQTQTHTNLKA